MLQMEISKCWKNVEFPKISIKMKNYNPFYGAEIAGLFKETISPPPPPPPPTLHPTS